MISPIPITSITALRHMFSQFGKTLLITPLIMLYSVLLPLIMNCVQFMNFHTVFFPFLFSAQWAEACETRLLFTGDK